MQFRCLEGLGSEGKDAYIIILKGILILHKIVICVGLISISRLACLSIHHHYKINDKF